LRQHLIAGAPDYQKISSHTVKFISTRHREERQQNYLRTVRVTAAVCMEVRFWAL